MMTRSSRGVFVRVVFIGVEPIRTTNEHHSLTKAKTPGRPPSSILDLDRCDYKPRSRCGKLPEIGYILQMILASSVTDVMHPEIFG